MFSYGDSSNRPGSTGSSQVVGPLGRTGNKTPKGYNSGQLQQFTPEQMQMFQQMSDQLGGGSYLDRLSQGDQDLFGEIEAPALKQFAGLQGNMASRFSGMGSGSRKSSGFMNTSNQAASDFAQQLQSNRQGLQRQATLDLSDMRNQFLNQKPYETYLAEKGPSFTDKWLQMAAAIMGGAAKGGF